MLANVVAKRFTRPALLLVLTSDPDPSLAQLAIPLLVLLRNLLSLQPASEPLLETFPMHPLHRPITLTVRPHRVLPPLSVVSAHSALPPVGHSHCFIEVVRGDVGYLHIAGQLGVDGFEFPHNNMGGGCFY